MSGSILPLRMDGVYFDVDGMSLIKDMTLMLEPGRRTAIIGPNGAGKSLLLRLMHGLIAPSRGTIAWQGDRAQGDAGNLMNRQAMVFQRPVMLRRSVRANLDYALKLLGLSGEARRARTDDILARTGLRRLADTPARVLSGGEQQRLALARAWARSPDILFLDEPTAALDPAATHRVEEIIDAIHAAGTGIVMTTHDLGQAKRIADDIMFMHRGRLFEHRPTDEFFEQPENDLAQAFVRGELLWWKRGEGTLPRKHQV